MEDSKTDLATSESWIETASKVLQAAAESCDTLDRLLSLLCDKFYPAAEKLFVTRTYYFRGLLKMYVFAELGETVVPGSKKSKLKKENRKPNFSFKHERIDLLLKKGKEIGLEEDEILRLISHRDMEILVQLNNILTWTKKDQDIRSEKEHEKLELVYFLLDTIHDLTLERCSDAEKNGLNLQKILIKTFLEINSSISNVLKFLNIISIAWKTVITQTFGYLDILIKSDKYPKDEKLTESFEAIANDNLKPVWQDLANNMLGFTALFPFIASDPKKNDDKMEAIRAELKKIDSSSLEKLLSTFLASIKNLQLSPIEYASNAIDLLQQSLEKIVNFSNPNFQASRIGKRFIRIYSDIQSSMQDVRSQYTQFEHALEKDLSPLIKELTHRLKQQDMEIKKDNDELSRTVSGVMQPPPSSRRSSKDSGGGTPRSQDSKELEKRPPITRQRSTSDSGTPPVNTFLSLFKPRKTKDVNETKKPEEKIELNN